MPSFRPESPNYSINAPGAPVPELCIIVVSVFELSQPITTTLEVCVPLYDYQCDTCGHRFEVRQGIREDPLTVCPQCGSPIRRVIHPVGIVFKGSGFYINDSRNASSSSKPANNGDGAGGDKGDKDKGDKDKGDKDKGDKDKGDKDKGDKKEGGSTETAAASGDKSSTVAAPAGDGAKNTSGGNSPASGSATSASNTSSSS